MVPGPGELERADLLWDLALAGVLKNHNGLVRKNARGAESLEYLGGALIAVRRVKQY